MAKVTKVFKWLSVVLGMVGAIVLLVLLFASGDLQNSEWWMILLGSAMAFAAPCGFVWLIYLIYAGVKAIQAVAAKDTRPRLLSGPQNVVVWVVALLLTVFSIWHGLVDAWDSWDDEFDLSATSLLWFAVFPILLMGAALFLYFMRRKEEAKPSNGPKIGVQ